VLISIRTNGQKLACIPYLSYIVFRHSIVGFGHIRIRRRIELNAAVCVFGSLITTAEAFGLHPIVWPSRFSTPMAAFYG